MPLNHKAFQHLELALGCESGDGERPQELATLGSGDENLAPSGADGGGHGGGVGGSESDSADENLRIDKIVRVRKHAH